jgi:hypothetical protein
MSDLYKYLFNIFEGVEEKEDLADPVDIEALGEKVELAQAANIDVTAFFEKCQKKGLSMKASVDALGAELAKTPPKPASDPAKT